MSKIELEHYEKMNSEFTEKLLEKGCMIPEFSGSEFLVNDGDAISGNFLALFSLKTIIDDKPFYFTPFVAFSDEDLSYQISCCNDYKCRICKLGYYDSCSGGLFTDYEELETVHEYFMNHNKMYRDVTKIFGNVCGDEIPSVYGQICDKILNSDSENNDKIVHYIEFLRSIGVYVPDIDLKDKSVKKRFKSLFKNFSSLCPPIKSS